MLKAATNLQTSKIKAEYDGIQRLNPRILCTRFTSCRMPARPLTIASYALPKASSRTDSPAEG